jgi:hypothetical protein
MQLSFCWAGAVLRYFGAATLAVAIGIASIGHPAFAASLDDTRSDAAWVVQAQLADGAIAHHVDKVAIWPYLSSFAAIGLTRASDVTGDPSYRDAAWRWTSWYQAHMNAQGYVTDYQVAGTVETSTGDMDSTDSYAAMYLMALRNAWASSSDRTKLEAARAGVAKAVAAIESTQQADGLTWAKPSWHVKYLMDNVEVYAGLRAAAELARALGDATLEDRATADATRVKQGVSALWNPTTGSYDWAVHENGARQSTNWSVFYPDAAQQMWAVGFGLVDASRAAALVAKFEQTHPLWDKPSATDTYDTGAKAVGYWAPIGWAYQRVGNTARAALGATNIRAAALATNRAWPFTPSDAGQLMVLGTTGRSIFAPDSLPPRVVTTTTTVPKTTTTTALKATTTTTVKTTKSTATTQPRRGIFSPAMRFTSRHSSDAGVARFAVVLAIALVFVGSRAPRRASRARR